MPISTAAARTMTTRPSKRFVADRAGSISVVYALILATVMGVAGLALDYARAMNARNQLQSALDSAVLAAVTAEPQRRVEVAQAFFDLKKAEIDATEVTPKFLPSTGDVLEGTAQARVETMFGGLFGIEQFTVATGAAAVLREETQPQSSSLCVLVKDQRAPQALLVNSGAKIFAPQCEVHVQSLNSPAAIFNAGAGMSVARTCVAGSAIIDNGISNALGGVPGVVPGSVPDWGVGISDAMIATFALADINTNPVHDVSLSETERVRSYTIDRKAKHAFVDFIIDNVATGTSRTEREKTYYSDVIAAAAAGPNITTSCNTASDPYVFSMPTSPPGKCKTEAEMPRTINGGAITLSPGTYCGWYNFNAAPDVTFAPGLYVIQGGGWNVNGGTWSGEGVTFYFADNSVIQFNSAVAAQLTAPGSGPYANIVMFEAPELPASNFVFNDANSFVLEGIVYLPSRNVTFNSGSRLTNRQMMLVVNTLIWNGTTWDLVPIGASAPVESTGKKQPMLVR